MNHAVSRAIENIRIKSQGEVAQPIYELTINFHPDRYTADGTPLLSAIAQDGYLKSQFETKTSNGGLTAYQGGERWLWEQRVFDGAYDHSPDNFRPKYGALNYQGYGMGASPRFGSSFFLLKPHVFERTTFCYPDSFFEPKDFAVAEQVSALVELAKADNHDQLDDYIEAHIHGEISIKNDIECVVLDPCYRATIVEEYANGLGIPVRWHNGFGLSIEEMGRHPDYRGPQFVELAKEIAPRGVVTPDLLGQAVTEFGYEEQDVKKIWHYLARFGYRKSSVEA